MRRSLRSRDSSCRSLSSCAREPPTWRGLVTVSGGRPSGRLDEGPARCQQRHSTGAGRINLFAFQVVAAPREPVHLPRRRELIWTGASAPEFSLLSPFPCCLLRSANADSQTSWRNAGGVAADSGWLLVSIQDGDSCSSCDSRSRFDDCDDSEDSHHRHYSAVRLCKRFQRRARTRAHR